jgi:hypothetical protein
MDYPLAAMTTFGLFLLVGTRGWRDGGYCIAFALWSGLGMNVKLTYALYLALPCLLALVAGLRAGPPRARVLLNAALCAAFTATLPIVVQQFALDEVWRSLTMHALPGQMASLRPPDPWTLGWATAIPGFVLATYSLPLLLLALPGLVLLHRRGSSPLRAPLLGLLWGIYLALTLMTHKMERYCYPLYPLLCLSTAWWLLRTVPARWQRAALGVAAAAHLGVLVYAHEVPPPWLVYGEGTPNAFLVDTPLPSRWQLDQLRHYRTNIHCQFQPLLQQIVKLAAGGRGVLGISVVWNSPYRIPRWTQVPTLASQLVRQRLIEDMGPLNARTPLQAPVVLLHSPRTDPRRVRPGLRLTHQTRVTVHCGRSRLPVMVSYHRGAGPGRRQSP